MADAAVHFHAHQFEFRVGRKIGRENFQGLLDGVELRAALAANGDDDFGHSLSRRSQHCNGSQHKFSPRIFGG